MFKKIIIFFCASLLLLGVAGCTDNDGKKTDNNETDGNVKCSEILEEILTEATGTHTDKKLFYDDEKYEEYFEYLYNTSVKRVSDGAFAYASSAYADEITVLYAEDKDDVDTIVKHLEDRISNRIQDFNGYKPEEVAKLENAVIKTSGNYIIMAVSDEADTIIEIFEKIVGGK